MSAAVPGLLLSLAPGLGHVGGEDTRALPTLLPLGSWGPQLPAFFSHLSESTDASFIDCPGFLVVFSGRAREKCILFHIPRSGSPGLL